MIDPTKLTYQLIAVGAQLPLPVSALQWEEQPGELAVRVQATLPNVRTSAGYLHQLIALGTPLALYADWGSGRQEVWRGRIWTWRYTDRGAETLEITAYDDLIALQQSEDDRIYPEGAGAADVLFDILQDWGLDTAGITGLAGVTLPKLVFRGATISQMVLSVLDAIYWRRAGIYVPRFREGMFEIVKPGQNQPIYQLSAATIEEFSDEQDLHDLVTEVQVIGALADDLSEADDVRPAVIASYTGHTEFGRLRALIRQPDADSDTNALDLANQLLMERGEPKRVQRLSAPDLPFLRRGDAVAIQAGTLDGIYLINGIQHDADRKQMQITIDTSGHLEPIAPALTYPEEAVGRINPYREPRAANAG